MHKHIVASIVAVALLSLTLLDGGYDREVYAGMAVLSWWTVIVGLATGAWPRSPLPLVALIAGGCLSALALLAALSAGWASDDGAAVSQGVRAAAYAGVFALAALAVKRGEGGSVLAGVAVGAIAVAALALGSRLEPGLPGDDRLLATFLPAAESRLSYPVGYWNGLAALMAVGAVLATSFGAQAGSRIGRSLGTASLPLVILAGYLTSSRGGIAAAAIGLAALIALSERRAPVLASLGLGGVGGALLVALTAGRDDLVDGLQTATARSQGDEVILAVLLMVLGVGALRWALDPPLLRIGFPRSVGRAAWALAAVGIVAVLVTGDLDRRFEDFKRLPEAPQTEGFVSSHLASTSGSGRWQFWEAGMDAFGEQPLRGIGGGAYEAWWSRNGSIPGSVRDAHSLFVETAGELGIIGLLLLAVLFGVSFASGAARLARGRSQEAVAALAVLCAGTVSAAIDWTWELPAVFLPVVLAMALLTGAATGPDAARAVSRRWLKAGTIAVGAVLTIGSLLVFASQLELDRSRDAVERGDLEAALEHAQAAQALEPWAAEPRLQVALVKEEDGDLRGARSALAEAVARAREDWRLYFVSTRVETEAGRVGAAERALRRARELNRTTPEILESP